VNEPVAARELFDPNTGSRGGYDHGVVGRKVLGEGCLQLTQFHLTHQVLVDETGAEIPDEVEQEVPRVVTGRAHMNDRVHRNVGDPGISK
jgi:hypothetical protein